MVRISVTTNFVIHTENSVLKNMPGSVFLRGRAEWR